MTIISNIINNSYTYRTTKNFAENVWNSPLNNKITKAIASLFFLISSFFTLIYDIGEHFYKAVKFTIINSKKFIIDIINIVFAIVVLKLLAFFTILQFIKNKIRPNITTFSYLQNFQQKIHSFGAKDVAYAVGISVIILGSSYLFYTNRIDIFFLKKILKSVHLL